MLRWRVRLARVLLVVAVLGWPVSAFTFARGEPATVLALSWIAIQIAAIDVLFTAQVHERQGREQASEPEPSEEEEPDA